MKALLQRFADTPFGVFSYLDLWDDADVWLARFAAAEDDWLDNAPRISCIPAGTYLCVRSVWHGGGDVETFEITGVPGRDRILFHWMNTEEDVEGCVGIGFSFGALTVADEDAPGHPQTLKWGLAAPTRKAFARFMGYLTGVQRFSLEIRWAAPGSWR